MKYIYIYSAKSLSKLKMRAFMILDNNKNVKQPRRNDSKLDNINSTNSE